MIRPGESVVVQPSVRMSLEHVALKALPGDRQPPGAHQTRSMIFMEYSSGPPKRKKEVLLLANLFPLARQQTTLENELHPQETYRFFTSGPRYF